MPGFGSVGSYPLSAPDALVFRAVEEPVVVEPYVPATAGAPMVGWQPYDPVWWRRRIEADGAMVAAAPVIVGHGFVQSEADAELELLVLLGVFDQ